MAEDQEKSTTPNTVNRAIAGLELPGEAALNPRSEANVLVWDAVQRRPIAKAKKTLEEKISEEEI